MSDAAVMAPQPRWAGDAEAAYLLGGWAFLDDPVQPDVQVEYLQQLHRARRQASAAARLQLLTTISLLPPPACDLLRAYVTTGLRRDVLAALFRIPEEAFWCRLVAAGQVLLPRLTPQLLPLLPAALLDAVADADDLAAAPAVPLAARRDQRAPTAAATDAAASPLPHRRRRVA